MVTRYRSLEQHCGSMPSFRNMIYDDFLCEIVIYTILMIYNDKYYRFQLVMFALWGNIDYETLIEGKFKLQKCHSVTLIDSQSCVLHQYIYLLIRLKARFGLFVLGIILYTIKVKEKNLKVLQNPLFI